MMMVVAHRIRGITLYALYKFTTYLLTCYSDEDGDVNNESRAGQ